MWTKVFTKINYFTLKCGNLVKTEIFGKNIIFH